MIIKKGDTWSTVEATLQDAKGTINLVDATVKFIVADRKGTTIVDRPATITDAANGKVQYSWQAGDTDTVGIYQAEFEVTFPDGQVVTVPNDGYIQINIIKDLG